MNFNNIVNKINYYKTIIFIIRKYLFKSFTIINDLINLIILLKIIFQNFNIK